MSRVAACVFEVRAYLESAALAGRDAGSQLGRQIRRELERLPAGHVLTADFRGVQSVNYFALFEMLTELYPGILGAVTAEKYLIICADEENADLFEALHLIARRLRCAIPAVSATGQWRPAGKLTAAERDTLAVLMEARALTAAQLQERLHLLPSAASNRLRKLHQMRLIRREEQIRARHGGREFLYLPLCVTDGASRRPARFAGIAGKPAKGTGA